MKLREKTHCRISGESLAGSRVLFEIAACPVPGVYPESIAESLKLRTPLKVIQAEESGFTQLAHCFDSQLYSEYAFAGGRAEAYRRHLEWFSGRIAGSFDRTAAILEVGCGDGFLIETLRDHGYHNALGIDPSRAAVEAKSAYLLNGYFPEDLPKSIRNQKYKLIVCRHVLEHIEDPRPFVAAMVEALDLDGELWIEVPDLDSTLNRGLWSNFYQLHCNYFSSQTLDNLAGICGLKCIGGEIVAVFGGSLLKRYQVGPAVDAAKVTRVESVPEKIAIYQSQLDSLASSLPEGAVGYGAAERTAMILGSSPALELRLSKIYDGNPLLGGRYLAGTGFMIHAKEELFLTVPTAIVLFAISNAREILSEWTKKLPPTTLVALADGDFKLKPLKNYL